MDEGLAEFYGAMLGDGCLSHYYSKRDEKYRFLALLTGHAHDEQYYTKFIQPILLKEFDTGGCLWRREERNAILLRTENQHIVRFLIDLGYPIGMKREIRIPERFFHKEELMKGCIRGIFDTDGSIYQRYSKQYSNHPRKYNYSVIQFKMNSSPLIEQIKRFLEQNGIQCNRIILETRSCVLQITRQDSVAQFMHCIKPHNSWHTERFLNGLKLLERKSGP